MNSIKTFTSKTILAGIFLVFGIADDTTAQTSQQYIFTGTVTEAKTGKPLAGVNVYISGTNNGAATDSTGHYRFTTRQTGLQEIVASFVGFKREIQSLVIGSKNSYQVDFKLKENILELEEVSVVASNRNWKRQYELFRNFFLGNNSFSKNVIIENPEALDFQTGNSSSELIATAKEALIIQNNALGYQIRAELDRARFNVVKNTGFYKVYPVFEPMETPDKKTAREWREQRERAYEGSVKHFLESLYHDNIRANKFYMDPSWGLEEANIATSINILKALGADQLNERYKVFQFTAQKINVGYDPNFDRGGRILNFNASSQLVPGREDPYFLVNSDGQLFDPQSIEVSGSWANDRFAKQLPSEFSLEDSDN